MDDRLGRGLLGLVVDVCFLGVKVDPRLGHALEGSECSGHALRAASPSGHPTDDEGDGGRRVGLRRSWQDQRECREDDEEESKNVSSHGTVSVLRIYVEAACAWPRPCMVASRRPGFKGVGGTVCSLAFPEAVSCRASVLLSVLCPS